MKTFLLTTIATMFFYPCFSQAEILLDSTFNRSPPERKKMIRCGATFTNSKNPLYIVDGVPMRENEFVLENMDVEDIVSIDVLKNPPAIFCYGTAGQNGVVLISTKVDQKPVIQEKELPFKVYCIGNDNWNTTLDVFTAIRAKVPNVSITTNLNPKAVPNIRMRGDDNTIVIVDGIRTDASILNSLNPADIEKIKVATSLSAANYLMNN